MYVGCLYTYLDMQYTHTIHTYIYIYTHIYIYIFFLEIYIYFLMASSCRSGISAISRSCWRAAVRTRLRGGDLHVFRVLFQDLGFRMVMVLNCPVLC